MSFDSALVNRLHSGVGEALDERDAADEVAGRRPLGHDDRRQFARQLISRQLAELDAERLGGGTEPVTDDEARRLTTAVLNRLFGIGRLQAYIDDPQWTDIHANGFDEVWLTAQDGSVVAGEPVADTDTELIELIQTQARRGRSEQRWDPASPELDMRLPSGDRLHAIAWVSGRPSVSIRRHNFDISRLKQLIGLGTISESLFHLLQAMVRARFNVIVAGGTGAGKTTLLRCLLNEVAPTERIITVEDSLEIGLEHFATLHPNRVDLEAREANLEGVGEFPMHRLVRSGLRMQPDRVIVGEVRGAEALPMMLAMSQGNDGSMCTIHADSSLGVFTRLQMYMAMTPERFDVEVTNLMIANAVHFVLHLGRLDSNERVVTSVREITGADGPMVTSNEVYAPDNTGRAMPRFTFRDANLGRLERVGFDSRWLSPDMAGWQR
ncbi:MAG: ATPase, T2SS/T4P/T4SS family [Acidimicrobiales bacterium]|nr:ATPase, T2SS/T4P/T4SS family [Acidimicrobiales bacterium]